MSNELIQAGESVQNLAKQYASVIKLGAELVRIGSLENYEREVQARIAQALEREKAVSETITSRQITLSEQVAKYDAVKAAHLDEIQKFRDGADAAAAVTVNAANEAAQKIHDEAAAREKAFTADFELQQRALAELVSSVSQRTEQLKQLEEQIASLKAKFV
jgi:hypothetical protein